jgi:hypothetical protein
MKKFLRLTATVMLGLCIGDFMNTQATAATSNAQSTTIVTNRYATAAKQSADWLSQQNQWDAWSALAVSRSPQGLTAVQKAAIRKQLTADVNGATDAGALAKTIIGATAIGDDPTNFAGRNIVDELAALVKDGTTGGLYTDGPALCALSTGDYGDAAKKARQALVTSALAKQQPTGEWKTGLGSIDVTGFMLKGLALNQDQPGVKAAIQKAVTKVSTDYYNAKTGYLVGTSGFETTANANTIGTVLEGLSACGVDVSKGLGATHQGVSPLDGLMHFYQANGSFKWQDNSDGSIYMATEQASMALDQYLATSNASGSIYAPAVNASDNNGQDSSTVDKSDSDKDSSTATKPNSGSESSDSTNKSESSSQKPTNPTTVITNNQRTDAINALITTGNDRKLAIQNDTTLTSEQKVAAYNDIDTIVTTYRTKLTQAANQATFLAAQINGLAAVNRYEVAKVAAPVIASPNQTNPTTTTPKVTSKTTATKSIKVIYSTTKLNLYRNQALTQRATTYAKRTRTQRPTFTVLKQLTNRQGVKVYYVVNRISGRKGYISASNHYTTNAYYQTRGRKIKIISRYGLNGYQQAGLQTKKKHYRFGTTLTVKRIVKRGLTTRFQLADGSYVSGNKTLVLRTA